MEGEEGAGYVDRHLGERKLGIRGNERGQTDVPKSCLSFRELCPFPFLETCFPQSISTLGVESSGSTLSWS